MSEGTTVITDPIAGTVIDLDFNEMTDGPSSKAHIVNPPDNPHMSRYIIDWQSATGQDVVDIARVRKLAIMALCGYWFVPQKDPDKHEACDACITIAGHIMKGLGE